jgi:hypothetical protein
LCVTAGELFSAGGGNQFLRHLQGKTPRSIVGLWSPVYVYPTVFKRKIVPDTVFQSAPAVTGVEEDYIRTEEFED